VGATCIQSPVDLSSFDPASLKILDRLDDLERLLRSAAPPLASVSAAGAAAAASAGDSASAGGPAAGLGR